MRKIVTFSMVASAALLAACGGTESTNTADANVVSEMNATDAMEGTTNDTMTNMDASMGAADSNMMNASNAMDNASNAVSNATMNTTNAM